MDNKQTWDAIIVGGGLAGLSAGIYLGRATRKTLLVDSGHSMAVWEPQVDNYLGFSASISGEELLARGKFQAKRFGVKFAEDEIIDVSRDSDFFVLKGKKENYRAHRVLLATGILHIPPEIPYVSECLGHSMFFCKDCDGIRVQGKRTAVIGWNNEAVEYALALLHYSPFVMIATNGRQPAWDDLHADWLRQYEITSITEKIFNIEQTDKMVTCVGFADGRRVAIEAIFTTRGDIVHNKLGKALGADLDADGQIIVDNCCRTTVLGLYAAGCVTPANCQMIIAAGHGAIAAQSINRDLFEASLRTHKLRRFREEQLRSEDTEPLVISEA